MRQPASPPATAPGQQDGKPTAQHPGAGPSPRLWLVRHAQPDIAPGICYGRLDVPALAHASRSAAHALARALPRQVAGVWHSPLQRCELLALDLIGFRPDLTIKIQAESRLAELDFGTWEGRAWAAIPRAGIDAWSAQLHDHAPGGGESLSAMLARVAAALQDAARLAWAPDAPDGGGDVVWLTHAGVARCVAWLQQHGPQARADAARWPVAAPGYGAWVTLALPQPPSGQAASGQCGEQG